MKEDEKIVANERETKVEKVKVEDEKRVFVFQIFFQPKVSPQSSQCRRKLTRFFASQKSK